jgi:hypothetical protein
MPLDSFDKLNELYDIFTADIELMELLCDVTGLTPEEAMAVYDDNVRRSFADPTLIVAEELPFVDMSCIEGYSASGNYLVNRVPIEINIYAENNYRASLIYKAIKRLFKEHFEDAQVIHEGQRGTSQGIYCYNLRVKQFVES